MPSDPAVSKRVRAAVANRGFGERFFFGGDAWFLGGNFALGVYRERLTCRVGPVAAEQAIGSGNAGPMDITGKPMKGWIFVDPPHFQQPHQLSGWIDQVANFVSTLPTKTSKPKKKK